MGQEIKLLGLSNIYFLLREDTVLLLITDSLDYGAGYATWQRLRRSLAKEGLEFTGQLSPTCT